MTDCGHCHRPIFDGQELDVNGEHEICRVEWSRRCDANMCVKCGKDATKSPAGWSLYCHECPPDTPYRGYEGPAS